MGSYTSTKKERGERGVYHIKFMSCAPEDRQKLPEMMKQFKLPEGVERLGLFFPRGSNYMYAAITKYKDYATWEKHWADIAKIRQKGINVITAETDMFFEEVQL